jgi:4-hydroxythreonine-4-phosphate dehydrogenase
LNPRIAIACGDPAGIGPEISLKAALDPRVRAICQPVLFGSREVLSLHAGSSGLKLDGIAIEHIECEKPTLGKIAPAHGRAIIASAEAAIRAALAGKFDAVVGAPHTEAAIHAAGIEFDGYPSFVARVAGVPPEDGILMLCFEYQGREMRIAHVTLHTSVAKALAMITKRSILHTLRAVHKFLQNPRIAVGGVNPHAGEAGAFGREEIDIVTPALEDARREGIAVDGPIGADTLFQKPGYDAFVVMFHDQGHVAAKLLAPQRIAGLTIGTPVPFSSVAHGSALDIAGQGKANHAAMVEAITRLAKVRR